MLMEVMRAPCLRGELMEGWGRSGCNGLGAVES